MNGVTNGAIESLWVVNEMQLQMTVDYFNRFCNLVCVASLAQGHFLLHCEIAWYKCVVVCCTVKLLGTSVS